MTDSCIHDIWTDLQKLPPVRSKWPGKCFVCSEGHPSGLHLKFRHTGSGVIALCQVPDAYCGFDGMVHGGIISALMDEAAAYAIFARHGKLGVTREMTVRFLKPVPTDTDIIVAARIELFAETRATALMDIRSVDGTRLAEAESSWSFPRLSRIAALAGADEDKFREFLADCQIVRPD